MIKQDEITLLRGLQMSCGLGSFLTPAQFGFLVFDQLIKAVNERFGLIWRTPVLHREDGDNVAAKGRQRIVAGARTSRRVTVEVDDSSGLCPKTW